MGVDSDLIRGHIDTIILKSLYHGDKYGLEIIQEIEEKSNGQYELKQPTLYSCLKILENQGLISSYWEDSEIGGRRHYYKLTDQGKETYKQNQEEWLKSREIIDNLIYNTTVEYAPIYDNDAEKPIIDQEDTKPEQAEESSTLLDCYASDDQTDEFASFDAVENTAIDNFFDSNAEIADEADLLEIIEEPLVNQTVIEDNDTELVSLDNIEEHTTENFITEDDDNEIYSYSAFNDNNDDEIYEESNQDDDDIYTLANEEPEDADQFVEEPVEITPPTYINFNTNNYEEADLTNIEENDEDTELSLFSEEIEKQTEETDDELNESIEESNNFDNSYNQTIIRASEEEINNLYKTTENYENLQAGYTDETYKQMLNELESYGSNQEAAAICDKKQKPLTFTELTQEFEEEGIVVRKYEKQPKESNESKLYIKTNKIHLIKNSITFGIVSFALLLVYLIMNSYKEGYTYNFAFWPFGVAIGVCALLVGYSAIKFAINPYKKAVAKYAPRLSILISVLITIQLILIIYCVNLQNGFYSFNQETYNHLLWIIPLILSFIPIIQAFVYLPLYNSKNYHI